MLFNAIVLFMIVVTGIYFSCKIFSYEISHQRKLVAAGVFVILNVIPIPIPLVSLIIAPIGLYVALMDDSLERETVNKVFALTFVFAVIAVLVIYLPQV